MTESSTAVHKKPVLPQYVRNLLGNIAVDAGFRDIDSSCVDVKAGSNQDDGFFGNLVAVTIGGNRTSDCNGNENGDSDEKRALHLLCKLMPGTAESRDEMNMIEIFKREAFFYQKVFPAFEHFQTRKGLDATNGFFGYPKCYACVCDEAADQFVIIMEDLRHRQYEMWPKKEPVDLRHVRCVLREMAKFHAVSFALKAEQPGLFAELRVVHDLFRGLLQRQTFVDYFNGSHRRAIDMIGRHLPQHAAALRAIWQNAATHWDAIRDGSVFEPYAVLVHADCWNNNILFQYDRRQRQPSDRHSNGGAQHNGSIKNNSNNNNSNDFGDNTLPHDEHQLRRQPDNVCFVDWQFSNYNSPALDLLYYIFTATDKALRDAHYDDLIRFYHRTLSETIQLLGNDAEQLYPFAVMNEQLRTFGVPTYLVVPLTIDVALADPGDIVHFDEIISANATAGATDAPTDAVPETIGRSEMGCDGKGARKDFLNDFGNEATRHAYQKRMVDIAHDLIELGYIDGASTGGAADTNGHHTN